MRCAMDLYDGNRFSDLLPDSKSRLRNLSKPHAAPPIPALHPTRATKVPAGPDWIHEIKHDGYRLIVQKIDQGRGNNRVRLFTRNGHDWTDRYPLIVAAALRNRTSSFVIDGEAVLLGVMACRISTACIRAGMMTRCSFTRSIRKYRSGGRSQATRGVHPTERHPRFILSG
jgi:ATP dependent DNA ligase domain